MPTPVEEFIFNELPKRVGTNAPLGSNFGAGFFVVATGNGFVVEPVNPDTVKTMLGIDNIAYGFTGITDVVPTDSADNVFGRVTSDDGFILQSCSSTTQNVTIKVIAVTGIESFKPTITVSGLPVALTRSGVTDTWVGSIDLVLPTGATHTVTATSSEGTSDSVDITMASAPVISSAYFSNAYSQGVGQTEHAAGQTLNLTVEASDFVSIEVVDEPSTATLALSDTFTSTSSKTVVVTVANRGNTTNVYNAKVRVQDVNGTWSAYYLTDSVSSVDGTNVVSLNNTYPSTSFGSIQYPAGQFALKDIEQATVNVTHANTDTVSWTSNEVSISNPTTVDTTKSVTRVDPGVGYNISVNNLQVVAGRTANATSTTSSTVVWIAHEAPQVSITKPSRLRSGGNAGTVAQNHTITLHSTQRMQGTPSLNAGVGVFQGTWTTSDNGQSYTRLLQIHDNDAKGDATFSGLINTNLAGISVTSLTGDSTYLVAGFVRRSLLLNPLSADPLYRQVAIGTQVYDTSKLLAENESKGLNFTVTFSAGVADVVNQYTIVNAAGSYDPIGSFVYNKDKANAESITTNTAVFEVEETL